MSAFWTWQLVTAMLLSLGMQALQMGAYGTRIAGVRTGRIATAIALFGLVVTVSRTANMLYAPLIGALSDAVGRHGVTHATLEWEMRAVVFAGTIGSVAGALLLPLFVTLYVRGIATFERYGSMPRAVARIADPAVLRSLAGSVRVPDFGIVKRASVRTVPARLLVANLVLSAASAVGVVAAQYASVIDPDTARSTLMLSSIVNGLGTIAFAFVVDPETASIVDGAVRGAFCYAHVRTVIVWLSFTSIAGSLIGQLLFLPAAQLIASAAHLFRVG